MPQLIDYHSCLVGDTLTLPEGITQIESDAFSYREDIVNVIFPSSLTSIGLYAFRHCSRLKRVLFSEGLLSINVGAFLGCQDLSSVTLPNSLTSIGGDAFYGTGITSITIPANVDDIRSNPFRNCAQLSSIYVSRENAHYFSDGNCIVARKTSVLVLGCNGSIIPRDVTEIGECAFADCRSFATMELPGDLRSIGHRSFEGCDSLSYVEIPNGVKVIGNHAFSQCKNLRRVILPNSLRIIGESAFSGCISLVEIEIPDSVEEIGQGAFYYSGLTRIDLHDNIKRIGLSCFGFCSQLQSIRLPRLDHGYYCDLEGDEVGPHNYFEREDDTIDNSIPATLLRFNGLSNWSFEEESKWLFRKCDKISTVELAVQQLPDQNQLQGRWKDVVQAIIADGVNRIGDCYFMNCTDLIEVCIPNSVTSIGRYAFSGCRELKRVTLPPNLLYIGEGAFSDCGLEEITIPERITTLESCVFCNNYYLRTIRIPASVMKIDSCALSGCEALTTIELFQKNPDSLTIESSFLVNPACEYLEDPTATITIKVPIGTGYAYRHHPLFSQFTILPVL